MTDDDRYNRMRRFAVGYCVHAQRSKRQVSVEDIVRHSEVSHVTWRRVEDGRLVRSSTYAAFDKFFDLPAGSFQRAILKDADVVQLARALAVDTAPADSGILTPAEFVEQLARTHRLGAVEFGGLPKLPTQADRSPDELQDARPVAATVDPPHYRPEPGLPRPSGAETIFVQATGPDGERTYLPVTGDDARRLELVTLLRTDLGRDKNRDSFAEDLRQMLVKYSDHLLGPYRDEAFGRAGGTGD